MKQHVTETKTTLFQLYANKTLLKAEFQNEDHYKKTKKLLMFFTYFQETAEA